MLLYSIINAIHRLIDINDSIIREIISIINKDYLLSFTRNSQLISEEKPNELSLLKRKREPEFFKPKLDHNNIFLKEKTFSIVNSDKLEKIRQINVSGNIMNEIQPDPFNYEADNFKKLLRESSKNLKQEECNKEKIIINDKEGNILNNSFTNRNPLNKVKYFNIEKNISKKYLLDSGSHKKIKVIKNKKIVHINIDLLDKYSIKKLIKKSKKINFVIRNKTSSKYRGVSRNGNKWQSLIMADNKKYYLGSYPSEDLAARVYDIFAIKMRGIKARTNFLYSNFQIKNIFKNNFKIENGEISIGN